MCARAYDTCARICICICMPNLYMCMSLSLNVTKTQVMIIGRHTSSINILTVQIHGLTSMQHMLYIFERRCYRNMLRISWMEHVTHEDVFNMTNTKPTLLDGLICITFDLMIGRIGRSITTRPNDLANQADINYTVIRPNYTTI